jgi:hypothetical protein
MGLDEKILKSPTELKLSFKLYEFGSIEKLSKKSDELSFLKSVLLTKNKSNRL